MRVFNLHTERRCLLISTLLLVVGTAGCRRGVGQARSPEDGLGEAAPVDNTVPRVLEVGPGRKFDRPSAAARLAKNGDVIEIAAGVYEGDVAIWRQNNLTIRGVGGRPHLKADGRAAERKGIWVIKGRNTTVENIEFSGARVRDDNGAGIRQEGANLTVRRCSFHDNENGILANANGGSSVVIEHSEFANNGHGDGLSHNMYIGKVKSFTLRASYSHHAKIGHTVKSRARENYIVYNRIMDEETGTSSYSIDLPNGGVSYLIGNLIQQGPETDNPTIISYGAEGLRGKVNELYVINNTIVNDGPAAARFLFVRKGPSVVQITNNLFVGPGTLLAGPGNLSHNVQSTNPRLVDLQHYDYHLQPGSPAIDAGGPPGTANGIDLTPTAQYIHPAAEEPRAAAGALDVGAYERSAQ